MSRAQRRSWYSGSSAKRPRSAGSMAVDPAVKSLVASSQAISPPVTTSSSCSVPRVSHQCVTSLLTHADAADSGEARTTRYRDWSSLVTMVLHRWGVRARSDWSRNTAMARSRYQGRARRSRPCSSAGASSPSAAWL